MFFGGGETFFGGGMGRRKHKSATPQHQSAGVSAAVNTSLPHSSEQYEPKSEAPEAPRIFASPPYKSARPQYHSARVLAVANTNLPR